MTSAMLQWSVANAMLTTLPCGYVEQEEQQAEVAQRLQQQLQAIKVQFDRDRARLKEQEAELDAFKRAEDEQLQLASQLQQELLKLGKQFQRDRALLLEQVCACVSEREAARVWVWSSLCLSARLPGGLYAQRMYGCADACK